MTVFRVTVKVARGRRLTYRSIFVDRAGCIANARELCRQRRWTFVGVAG